MKKDDLVNAFSAVCAYIADNFQELLLPHLDDDIAMITPHFENAHIADINTWWEWDDHLAKYIMQIEDLAGEDPNSRQENINAGIEEIRENPNLWSELQAMKDGTDEGIINILKYIPHVAQYASSLTNTVGYKKLDALTQRMDNVIIWPMITLYTNAPDLKSAFSINVSVVSADGSPLKPKIQKFHRFNA
jgi:hypothetical protein